MKSHIADPTLAPQGALKIDFARRNMAPLLTMEEHFRETKPFRGLRIGMALHVTKETGVLVQVLRAGGAQVAIASCNPLSTQDDIAAFLAKEGVSVFAYKGESKADYYKFIRAVVAFKPHITIDDGCDLISEIHTNAPHLIPHILGGCEETTTGVHRLKAMAKQKALKYPVIAVNDNQTKHLFDNFYGTGQSTWDGILRATNILIAGKTVVVAGYGDCSRGIVLRARGLGAHVIVTEVDPVRALQAHMDGYQVVPMNQAAGLGDIFVTATGNKHVISASHFRRMKSGAILANSGHFNIEIDTEALAKMARKKREIRPHCMEYDIGSSKKSQIIYLLAEGRLVNLAAAEGHPSEVMALSFCGQALACEWITKKQRSGNPLQPGVHTLPAEIDENIARIALEASAIKIDTLSKEQRKYINSWELGT